MTTDEMSAALDALGASIIEEPHLPPGLGVLPQEAGAGGLPGPWYGIRFADGHTEGWARKPELLSSLVRARLAVGLLLSALASSVRDLRAADREIQSLAKSLHDAEMDLSNAAFQAHVGRHDPWGER